MAKRQVLRDEIQEMILSRLLESKWSPGSRVSIDGLARELGVSPTPVREAMVGLERSGLVEYAALRGYVVAPPLNEEQIVDIIDARTILETAALSRAFDHWEDLAPELEKAHQEHRRVIEKIRATEHVNFELLRQYFAADLAFHQVIFKHTHNEYLSSMVDQLSPHMHRMRQTWAGGEELLDSEDAYAEHAQIVGKVLQRNHDGALDAMRTHLAAVRERSLSDEDRPGA